MKINGQPIPGHVTHEQAVDFILNMAVGRAAFGARPDAREQLLAELRQLCPSEQELNQVWSEYRVRLEDKLTPPAGPYSLLDHGHVIRCNTCMKVSWNTNDVIHRYCGHCKAFHED
jgi:phage FluMu protein Com